MKWKILFLVIGLFFIINTISAAPFMSYWNTSITSTGSSNASQITLPIVGNITVQWGDGTTTYNTTSHNYTSNTNMEDIRESKWITCGGANLMGK